ncbi:MAG: hypothetical protein GY711_11245 [bacterium]|nr:hypothetical protein [bacterium]
MPANHFIIEVEDGGNVSNIAGVFLIPDCNNNGVDDTEDIFNGTSLDLNGNGIPDECEPIGTNYCGPAIVNSSGNSATILAFGSPIVLDNDVVLEAFGMPLNQFGYFLASSSAGFIANPGGSAGNFCLGSGPTLGRYSNDVMNSGQSGSFSMPIDTFAVPIANGPPVGMQPGVSWFFQCWYRDNNPGPTSNFTDAVSVAFQ